MIVVTRDRNHPKLTRVCLLVVTAFSVLGCGDGKPESVGPAQELVVLADPEEWVLLEPHVRDIFEKVLRTPQVEKIYSVRHGRVEDIKASKHLRRKNLMVLSTIDAENSVGEFLRTLLSPNVAA
ncbi:uncharacterized protein METZ01_LOCUS420133, partial [marine metagenome]